MQIKNEERDKQRKADTFSGIRLLFVGCVYAIIFLLTDIQLVLDKPPSTRNNTSWLFT